MIRVDPHQAGRTAVGMLRAINRLQPPSRQNLLFPPPQRKRTPFLYPTRTIRGERPRRSHMIDHKNMYRAETFRWPQFILPAAAKIWLLLVLLFSLPTLVARGETIDFARDIRPLLAAKCLACHGPDENHREADLRLDDREAAVDFGAIVPGDPEESEMIRRIFAEDAEELMPPPETNTPLTAEEKDLLRRWVEASAEYAEHWAFVALRKPRLPEVRDRHWPRNGIDHFVLARLEAEGIEPSPEADRLALARRVYLDLIGLPPTPEEADAFLRDTAPGAYERLVDRLLASPHYGERWARQWLDLARYADTNGYEKDRERSIWPYRDWVIRALNADLPFDQFTIEQLAGDMLPDASDEQRIATGFHRNTMLNEEGGIDPLEYRFYAMVDRAATTGTVWLGLSVGCAQCHTHKYDPITHTDYYKFMALLNNADEPEQRVRTRNVSERRQDLQARIEALEAGLAEQFPPAEGDSPVEQRRRESMEIQFHEWLATTRTATPDWRILRPTQLESNLPRLELLPDGSVFSSGDITKRDVFHVSFNLDESVLPLTALRLEVLPDERLPAGGPGRAYYEGRKGDFFLSELSAELNGTPLEFASPSHSYGNISIGSGTADAKNVLDGDGSTGWSTAQREGEPHQLVLNLAEPITQPGELQVELLFERHFAASLGRFRFSAASRAEAVTASDLPFEIEELLTRSPDKLTTADREYLQRYFLRVTPELAQARQPLEDLRAELPAFPTTLVMQERPADHPRPTFRHHRGEFLSPREAVTPGIPEFLTQELETLPQDRLALARWLVSETNPLVGRVTVNRAWQAFFGTGLHRTSGDFGTQAEPPTHGDLLDWLAREFIEQNWSLKQVHRLIVTSATYRQSSKVSPDAWKRDPANELLARGPRFRVPAEMVRDLMLRASGQLSPKMYGPGVHPPQPASVTALAYGNPKWNPSPGADRFRRSLYTFHKRTAPFAAYAVFDAPTGETCVARRDRSNTPLQALTLLNDEMYLEMARALAQLAITEASSEEEIACVIFRRLLTRPPEPEETAAVMQYQQAQLARLAAGELEADVIAGKEGATDHLASWVMVARSLMNLDEAISKE